MQTAGRLKMNAVNIGSLAVGTAPYDDCGMRFTGTISIKVKIYLVLSPMMSL